MLVVGLTLLILDWILPSADSGVGWALALVSRISGSILICVSLAYIVGFIWAFRLYRRYEFGHIKSSDGRTLLEDSHHDHCLRASWNLTKIGIWFLVAWGIVSVVSGISGSQSLFGVANSMLPLIIALMAAALGILGWSKK